jgi:uncharacterized protein YydD (DUF2326 family)
VHRLKPLCEGWSLKRTLQNKTKPSFPSLASVENQIAACPNKGSTKTKHWGRTESVKRRPDAPRPHDIDLVL